MFVTDQSNLLFSCSRSRSRSRSRSPERNTRMTTCPSWYRERDTHRPTRQNIRESAKAKGEEFMEDADDEAEFPRNPNL